MHVAMFSVQCNEQKSNSHHSPLKQFVGSVTFFVRIQIRGSVLLYWITGTGPYPTHFSTDKKNFEQDPCPETLP